MNREEPGGLQLWGRKELDMAEQMSTKEKEVHHYHKH